MSQLDTSGRLLEGVRASIGNNSFTFPPRNFVSNETAFQIVNSRAEYAIIVGSLDSNDTKLDIANPNLIFYYTKNESNIIRFDYDSFNRRFFPAPGGVPNKLGSISNDPRLIMPVPDLTISSAPLDIYIGDVIRTRVFNLSTVPTDGDFSNPISMAPGDVEISEESGRLNFNQNDVDIYTNQIVLATRQSFLNRTQAKGFFGELPLSTADYHLFLNPRPASGQLPLIRIDYQNYLIAIEVPNEASLGSPISGTCHWSVDTGKVRFAIADIAVNPGRSVYYDGVFLGYKQLSTVVVGNITNPFPVHAFVIPEAIGNADPARFIISAESSGQRHYFPVTIINTLGKPPAPGTAYIEQSSGMVFFSIWDLIFYAGWSFSYTNTIIEIENGVSIQFYRSGVNGSRTSVAPDFTVVYNIENQRIVGGMGNSPIVLLPTVPIINSTLKFAVNQIAGSVGNFTGNLIDGTDPSKSGYGYLLDLDQRMLKFSDRKISNKKLLRPVSTIKLDDASLSQFGFEATKNGNPIIPGVDFNLDYTTGIIDFVQSVGENDPDNILSISGSAGFTSTGFIVTLNAFVTDKSVFSSKNINQYLFVSSGSNIGIYRITKFINPKKIVVDPCFKALENFSADLRVEAEIIVDRFWTPFLPPYKKFSISRAASTSDPYFELDNTEFNVFKNTGQINLDQPTYPGEHYQISYISIQLEDDGVTQTPINRVEKALFKVRQEEATVIRPGVSTPISPSISRDAFVAALAATPTEPRTCDGPRGEPAITSSTTIQRAAPSVASLGAISKITGTESKSSGFKVGMIFGTLTGSRTVIFNPAGNTVNTARPIEVFINGIPLEEDDFTFEPPGTLKFVNPIGEDQKVILNYWIEEATGNDTSFDLLHSPVNLDTPEIMVGKDTAEFNGDQTSTLSSGSAILIDKREVVIVESTTYDSADDVTSVKFETIPAISSDGSSLQATGPITGSYRITETNSVDVFSQGSNNINIAGDRTLCYLEGTIVTVDGDPYIVRSSSYGESNNTTVVNVAGAAKRNYILPRVTRTVRPVLFPTGSFLTRKEAHLSFPFTLVKMGAERAVLIQNVDYTLADGGTVQLSTEVQFGDSLFAMYVARTRQPALSAFIFNYAYAIAPNESNGIQGQELVATYDLYAPDSFFYRIETVGTFLPEVSDMLRQGSQTSSGPNISDVALTITTKNSGTPGPYFEEKHQENLDIAIARLLKYYNDLINLYEDILSNLDGRIVGGNNGRFRFDGNFDNPIRNNYTEITNDIDDQAKLYDRFVLTGFFLFDFIPIYGKVGEPNKLSRIFPTAGITTGAINDQVNFLNFGNTMGSLGKGNLRSANAVVSSRGRALIDSVDSTGTVFTIEKNGDFDNLIPRFEIDQKVRVYQLNGTPDVLGTVVSADTNEPATIVLDTPTTLKFGSLLRHTGDLSDSTVHFYTPGRDLIINLENGQIINYTLPPPLDALQSEVFGNEILDCRIEFNNTDIAPARIPVLDGEKLNDNESIPAPILKRIGENLLLKQELNALNRFGSAMVNSDRITITSSTVAVTIGQTIKFVSGPNNEEFRTVSSIINSISFIVSIPFSSSDFIGSDFTVSTIPGDDLISILNKELGILNINAEIIPAPPVQVGVINSEITTAENIIFSYGEQISDGIGDTAGITLIDPSADFTADGVNDLSLLYVPNGGNRGLYKVISATATQITIDNTSPFEAFPLAISAPYIIISKSRLISDTHPEFIVEFLRKTLWFLDKTQVFISNPTTLNIVSRMADINTRVNQINNFISQLEGVLSGEQIYDIRYLWIDQRVNRKEGTFVRKARAIENRQENIQKIINDQKKLLVVEALHG